MARGRVNFFGFQPLSENIWTTSSFIYPPRTRYFTISLCNSRYRKVNCPWAASQRRDSGFSRPISLLFSLEICGNTVLLQSDESHHKLDYPSLYGEYKNGTEPNSLLNVGRGCLQGNILLTSLPEYDSALCKHFQPLQGSVSVSSLYLAHWCAFLWSAEVF